MLQKDTLRCVVKSNETTIENDTLTWREAFELFATDLPALAERINSLTEETENLW